MIFSKINFILTEHKHLYKLTKKLEHNLEFKLEIYTLRWPWWWENSINSDARLYRIINSNLSQEYEIYFWSDCNSNNTTADKKHQENQYTMTNSDSCLPLHI